MKNNKPFTPKQVGERIKERRTELNLSMPELGRRVSVNKSTIQRYEADGVDPKRTMIINGLAQALLTTPEWLTGLSDEKEYSNYTVCQMSLEKHVKAYLETVTSAVDGEPRQEMLTTFLGQIIDLYAILTKYFALSMEKVNQVAVDEGLKESIRKYAINIGSITEQVFIKKKCKRLLTISKNISTAYFTYTTRAGQKRQCPNSSEWLSKPNRSCSTNKIPWHLNNSIIINLKVRS